MDEADGEDEATQAFEALREEVSRLRQGIERIYRQQQDVKAVDYSLTLGQMAKTLQAVQGSLAAIEATPALSMMPRDYRGQMEAIGRSAGEVASTAVWDAARAQTAAANELKAMVGRVREKREQRAWLATAGFLGMLAGLVLWMILVGALPVRAGSWMAALPLARGDRWQAGAVLMQQGDPDGFAKIATLLHACGDQPANLCAAGISLNAATRAGQDSKASGLPVEATQAPRP